MLSMSIFEQKFSLVLSAGSLVSIDLFRSQSDQNVCFVLFFFCFRSGISNWDEPCLATPKSVAIRIHVFFSLLNFFQSKNYYRQKKFNLLYLSIEYVTRENDDFIADLKERHLSLFIFLNKSTCKTINIHIVRYIENKFKI